MSWTRPDDPRVTRSKTTVLAVASSLIAEEGLGGATVDAIATRSGVAKTTIYRHWPDRNALLIAVLRHMAPPCSMSESGDLRRDLVQLLGDLVTTLYDSDYGRSLPSIVGAAERDSDIAELLERFGEARRRSGRRLLQRARKRGDFPAGVTLDALHETLVAPVFYDRLVRRVRPTRRRLETIVDRALYSG